MPISFLDNFDDDEELQRSPRCKHCGSTDVRWRQQGGRWVLFSLQPGVEHRCDPEAFASDFDPVEA